MKLFLSLFAAALVAGTLSAADATTSATKPQKPHAGAGAMSGIMDLRKALGEDDKKAMKELETKVRPLVEAYKKEASDANAKALKDQIAANYDAQLAIFQKVVDRTTDATEKAKLATVVKAMTDNKEMALQKNFERLTTDKPMMPPKGEKKNKK